MKTLGHSAYIKAWLVFILGATIIGGIIGAVMGRFVSLILISAGVSVSQITIVVALVGLALGIPVSYFMFYVAVKAFIVTKLEDESPAT